LLLSRIAHLLLHFLVLEVLDDFLVGSDLVDGSHLEALRTLLPVLDCLHLVVDALLAVGVAAAHENQGDPLRIKTLLAPVAKSKRLLH
jgi:hypothetical protein